MLKKTMIRLIVKLLDKFYLAFVFLKIYQWYSPYVGFEMPELDYFNVFSIAMISILIRGHHAPSMYIMLMSALRDIGYKESERSKIREIIVFPLSTTLLLFLSWFFYIILF